MNKNNNKVRYGDICSCNPNNGGNGVCFCTQANEFVDPNNVKKTKNFFTSTTTTGDVNLPFYDHSTVNNYFQIKDASFKFKIGDKVKKVKGYEFPGTIVSCFLTKEGNKRVVVEMTKFGLLHIFNEEQLELDTDKAVTITKRTGQSTPVISVLKDGNTTYACRINWEGKSEANYYIKFRTLLRWIQDNLIFDNVNGNKKTKALKFDLSVVDNLIYKNKYSVATDYTKVITRNVKFPDITTPDSTDSIDLLELPSDVEFTSDKNANAGKLMNIFLNLSWLVETLKSNVDSEGNISLFNFLQGICQGINSSLGYVNSIDVVVDEETNTIKFIDDKPIPGIIEDFNLNNTPTEFQVYAFSPTDRGLNGSFIRDFGIRTEVSNKLSTTLAIGAQAVNAVVTENATALQSWNEGLTDRTAKVKEDPTQDKEEKTA